MRVYLSSGGFQPPDGGSRGNWKPRDDFTGRSPKLAQGAGRRVTRKGNLWNCIERSI